MQTRAQPLSRHLTRLLPPPGAITIMAVTGLISSIGTGLFLTGSVLYYTRVVGLSDTQVGIGLSAAGACGILTPVPIGLLADRWGPRQVMIVLYLWRAAGYTVLALVHGFWSFLVVICLVTMADRAGPPCSQALVGTLFRQQERVHAMAYLRAVKNIGFSAGALLAGIALVVGTPTAYRLLSLGNAASFLPVALLTAGLRRYQQAGIQSTDVEEIPPPGKLRPLRDPPFLALAATNGLLTLHDSVLFVVLPLWVTQRTAAPHIMVSLLLTINTVLTAVSQVWWTRLTHTLPAAMRAMVAVGPVLAVASVLIGAAHLGGALSASVLLVLGVIALTAGENLHSASSWQISYGLSPKQARARYLAVFSLGDAGQQTAGPSLANSLLLVAGLPGWLGLGALFIVAGTSNRALATWVAARRAAAGVPPAPDHPPPGPAAVNGSPAGEVKR
jgi:MFS family permease